MESSGSKSASTSRVAPWATGGARRYVAATPLLMALALALSLWLDQTEPVAYAELQGGATEGSFSGRLRAFEELNGVVLPLANEELVVEMQGRRSFYTTDERGWVSLPLVATERNEISIGVWKINKTSNKALKEQGREFGSSEHGRLLEGRFVLKSSILQSLARRRSYLLEQTKECGEKRVKLTLSAPLAVPFEQRLRLQVLGEGWGIIDPTFSVQAKGVIIRKEASDVGRASLENLNFREVSLLVEPQMHQAQLILIPALFSQRAAGTSTQTLGKPCQYFWNLPVLPGAPHIEFSSRGEIGYRVTTPLRSEEIFFSLWSDDRRLGGGRLSLQPFGAMQAQGIIAKSRLVQLAGAVDLEELTLVVSTDSSARSVGSLPYPLGARKTVAAVPEILLLSGRERALKESTAHLKKRRLLLGVYFFCSVLLFLYLYYKQLREGERELTQAFEDVGCELHASQAQPWFLIVILLSLFFAFSLAVVWILR